MAKISIIIPLYNCAQYIGRCIESIQKQSYSNWEILIIDDQSQDDGYEICKKYQYTDNRIRLYQQLNSGSGPARNTGIEIATGDYLMFCDADDFLLDSALELLIQKAIATSADLVIGGYKEFKDENQKTIFCGLNSPTPAYIEGVREVRGRYIRLFDDGLIQAPWAKLYKSKIVKDNQVKFANYKRCQDTVFNLTYYDCISSVAIIADSVYAYQTPEGDTYIRKFPVDMIDIRLEIDKLLSDKLTQWNLLTEEAELVLCKVLMIDILVCCRLNFMNNWSDLEDDHIAYIHSLLAKKRVQEVISLNHYGIIRNTLCKVLSTGNYPLIKLVNKLLIKVLYR